MRNKLASALSAVVLVGGTLAAGVGSASAVTPHAPSTALQVPTASASGCYEHLKAKESLKIRKSPKLKATALGVFPKGKTATAKCQVEMGDYYHLCNDEDARWSYINYQGVKGWVPWICTKPAN
ncbi:SH3 domain-containing protein [Streptomyces sp. NRRL S-337]|uniref:SH3 domain-containing protein n=1 Tax=Streptomyces sp. NRRL S-337 TaxID=1463900 RepID=UPI00131B64DD|nr:SH3 domain-containing protein [Streptomyces sp. NRRL S-337]